MKRKSIGATLIEVMVSTAVFALVSMSLMVIFNIGIRHWRGIEEKSKTESFLNKSMIDINATLRNTDVANVFCSYDDKTGNGILICGSNASYDETNSCIMEKSIDCHYSGSGEFISLDWPFIIVYFTCSESPIDCNDCISCGFSSAKFCIHKKLVKRWFSIEPKAKVLTWPNGKTMNNIAKEYIEGSSGNIVSPNFYSPDPNKNDLVLASDIIFFKPKLAGDAVDYELKAFNRISLSKEIVNVDEVDKSLEKGLDNHSMLVSSSIYPLNNDSAAANQEQSLTAENPVVNNTGN